jgi:hypothetical protein
MVLLLPPRTTRPHSFCGIPARDRRFDFSVERDWKSLLQELEAAMQSSVDLLDTAITFAWRGISHTPIENALSLRSPNSVFRQRRSSHLKFQAWSRMRSRQSLCSWTAYVGAPSTPSISASLSPSPSLTYLVNLLIMITNASSSFDIGMVRTGLPRDARSLSPRLRFPSSPIRRSLNSTQSPSIHSVSFLKS